MGKVMLASGTAFKAIVLGASWMLWLLGLAFTICAAGRRREP
jgi:hypothetical protein